MNETPEAERSTHDQSATEASGRPPSLLKRIKAKIGFHPSVTEAHGELGGGFPESTMKPRTPKSIEEQIQQDPTPENNQVDN